MAETIAPGTTRYLCPLRCGWHHDVPPPSAADAVGIPVPANMADLNDPIGYLAAEASLRIAAATEAALAEHIGTHTTVEFVTVLERLHAEVRQGTAPGLDFFQPDHTYTHRSHDHDFLCVAVTPHPINGDRIAVGWRIAYGDHFLAWVGINQWNHEYDHAGLPAPAPSATKEH